MTGAVTPAALRELAVAVAVEAAALLRARRREGVEVAATKSTVLDIVTRADREAEDLVRARVLAARPSDGMLGEEGSVVAGTSGVLWVVDPLDGTVNYLYEAGPYAVSVAACRDEGGAPGEAIAGAVVVATEGTVFAAARGEGATADGRRLAVGTESRIDRALVSTGFGYRRAARAGQSAEVARMAAEVRDIRMGGSAATDLCLVAAGRLDAYVERYLAPWDYAAGGLIVREAGGRVEGERGGPPDAALVVAANPALVPALRSLLRPA